MKTCSKCKVEKSLDGFYAHKGHDDGRRSECKECTKAKMKSHYQKPEVKERQKAKHKTWVENNQERCRELKRLSQNRNREKHNARGKAYYKNNKSKVLSRTAEYYALNKETRVKQAVVLRNKKYKTDPNFRLRALITSRVNKAISRNQKTGVTLELLGCSIESLKNHLERQFAKGMNWENRGEWHIDHIIPCASFDLSDPDQQKQCFHYTNLQPLWAKDNLKKYAKIEQPIQMAIPL